MAVPVEYVILFLGVLSLGYSLYSYKAHEIHGSIKMVRFSMNRESESPVDRSLFWYVFVLTFVGGMMLTIGGVYLILFF